MNTSADGVRKHVEHLAVGLRNRPIGSAANRAAAQYIGDVFERAGLSVERQEIPCPDWAEEQTTLRMNGEPLTAYAITFSPACTISATTLAVGRPAELEAALSDKVLIFYGNMAQHELAAKGAIYVSERDRRVIRVLEERHPAAVITVTPARHHRWLLIEDYELSILSDTVPADVGLRLLKNAGATADLQIVTRRAPSQTSNVIGKLSGQLSDRIVVCAHYDTNVDTPGAYDNPTGVGAFLTLAEQFSKRNNRHAFEFVAFTGEEGYGLGDMEYARRARSAGPGFDQVTAAVNFDGVGPYTGTTTVACFAASAALETLVDSTIRNDLGVVKVELWPASDNYVFYSNGTPSIAFSSTGIKDVYHTVYDTFEWISGKKLAEVLQLAQQIIEALDTKDRSWSRLEA